MKNDFIEEWKEIKGYEGYYMISNLGRVYAIPRKFIGGYGAICSTGGYFLNKHINTHRGNRRFVELCIDGKKQQRYVNYLVGEAFIPNPDNKPETDHILPIIDGGGDEVFNLRWVTRKENMSNEMTKYRHFKNVYRKRVRQIKIDGTVIKEFDSAVDASKITGISRTAINGCCNKKPKYKTAGGYKWEYC